MGEQHRWCVLIAPKRNMDFSIAGLDKSAVCRAEGFGGFGFAPDSGCTESDKHNSCHGNDQSEIFRQPLER